MYKNNPNCKDGLAKNIINQEVFDREIGLCEKLSKENGGKCGWGECMKCGVIPLLIKLYKGEILEGAEAEKIKKQKTKN